MPGSVEEVPAKEIATRGKYKALAALGEAPVPIIYLNENYAPLRHYVAGRQKDMASEAGPERGKNRNAVGIGVGLVLLDQEAKKLAGRQANGR